MRGLTRRAALCDALRRAARHEQPTFLLCIGAEGKRNVSGCLDLRCLGEEFVPGLRWLQPNLLEDFRAVEHPVGAMDIHRRAINVPIDRDLLQQERRQVLLPSTAFASQSRSASKPCCASSRVGSPVCHCMAVGGLPPAISIRCEGNFRLRANRRIIDPFAPTLFVLVGENRYGAGCAAARPEMDDVCLLSRSGKRHCRREQAGQQTNSAKHLPVAPPVVKD